MLLMYNWKSREQNYCLMKFNFSEAVEEVGKVVKESVKELDIAWGEQLGEFP